MLVAGLCTLFVLELVFGLCRFRLYNSGLAYFHLLKLKFGKFRRFEAGFLPFPLQLSQQAG